MAARTGVPMLSDCLAPSPRRVSLTERNISRALAAFLLLAGLAVGHVYLQFTTQDLRLQQSHLQEQHRQLVTVEARLQQQNRALCAIADLHDYARLERQMMETRPDQQIVAAVPAQLKEKYTKPVITGETVVASAASSFSDRIAEVPVQRFVLSLLDVNKAYAGTVE